MVSVYVDIQIVRIIVIDNFPVVLTIAIELLKWETLQASTLKKQARSTAG